VIAPAAGSVVGCDVHGSAVVTAEVDAPQIVALPRLQPDMHGRSLLTYPGDMVVPFSLGAWESALPSIDHEEVLGMGRSI